jgi:hypothetical protein
MRVRGLFDRAARMRMRTSVRMLARRIARASVGYLPRMPLEGRLRPSKAVLARGRVNPHADAARRLGRLSGD